MNTRALAADATPEARARHASSGAMICAVVAAAHAADSVMWDCGSGTADGAGATVTAAAAAAAAAAGVVGASVGACEGCVGA